MQCEPLGYVSSCFKQKFGIPRQPGLVPSARGFIEVCADFAKAEAFDGLEQYSHIWIIFQFHQQADKPWQARVRPPRLGGDRKKGVFATRSPFRPNSIGLSVVRLESIEIATGRVRLHVSGLDVLDATPVFDIKPYLPYVDAVQQAEGGFAAQAPQVLMQVHFSEQAKADLQMLESNKAIWFEKLIVEILQLDPRPAYQASDSGDKIYAMLLDEFDVRWQVRAQQQTHVVEIVPRATGRLNIQEKP
ncbi:MAG: tRNA (N6-threonylcarbamoyladenosine(37)-N6)-methyltransferase TrmO [gamma proteobacterium symbiont of Bathyaustriella thionipta]|nr:tRNA (N6-threonylcarbamoyladenosine(37)-N6)-methyltransferase TrmO [gamma proteobacterium symbiont of Bathyaustriella thionipta]